MAHATDSILTLPAHNLQDKLTSGALTSVQLVESLLGQIEKHNHAGLKLNAVISVCPRAVSLSRARILDDERKAGNLRSNLHGIPIILKDAVVTGPPFEIATSAGSGAMATLRATRNATVVDRLVDAGVIILGKGNMTEFCGLKSDNTPIGWSAYGGQTLSAYHRDNLKEEDQPWCGGSSTGPAVSISAGFAPLGIGTETGGSNVFPASCNGVYALTLTRGSVPTDGVFKISQTFDAIGTMARDPYDIASLVDILLEPPGKQTSTVGSSSRNSDSSFDALSIGVVETKWGIAESNFATKWGLPEVVAKYEEVVRTLQANGARIVYPLDAPESDTLKNGEDSLHTVSSYTTQTELIAARDNTMTPSTHDAAVAAMRRLAQEEGMGRIMDELGLDIVLAASDSTLISFAAWAGWTIATVPAGNLEKNDQPWGLFALARGGREDVLLRFMAAFHDTFPGIRPPTRPFE